MSSAELFKLFQENISVIPDLADLSEANPRLLNPTVLIPAYQGSRALWCAGTSLRTSEPLTIRALLLDKLMQCTSSDNCPIVNGYVPSNLTVFTRMQLLPTMQLAT
jgi:hypothetical protein